MTTEDDFQAAIDANPDDWQTRLVFADWLEERDDPRAAGYRALGTWRVHPYQESVARGHYYWDSDRYPELTNRYPGLTDQHTIPDAVYHIVYGATGDQFSLTRFCLADATAPIPPSLTGTHVWSVWGVPTRREAEDAAALAFAKLPPERRAELLNPTTVKA